MAKKVIVILAPTRKFYKPATQEVLTEVCAVTGSLRFTNRPKNPARFNNKKK